MSSLIGVGLYSIPEASAITGIPTRKIRRWLFGYESGNKVKQPPLWHSDVATTLEETISFQDLLEIRFVHAFRDYGVPLPAIRVAAEHAREFFHQPYPFTCKRFQTDGQSIFATVEEETGDEGLVDLVKKQNVFKKIIKPSLYSGIEYDQGDNNALRWFPVKNSRKVVLDPNRSFGKPIVTDNGIRTETLYQSWLAEEQDHKMVAALYDVDVAAVNSAILFEQRIATVNEVHP
ncbi:DUF433 domain-containing protein [Endozoicomonas ascidiicola]|uniref:DUF433 domain-containing protein n=1 Tax=Endozoicomonas ascidiicola TaxID=1698521 RepID=UPI00082A4C45|nr:DUF433 domain-containing protein [Endozoicomonas ascidiicola]